jgi:hypothetical protein
MHNGKNNKINQKKQKVEIRLVSLPAAFAVSHDYYSIISLIKNS